jgi:hypothetical protein
MKLFWRENRLQIEPDSQKERDTLLLLTEQRGLRRTFAEPLMRVGPLPPLEIEIEKGEGGRWIGRIPAIVGVEYPHGLDKEDAKLGVLIEGFREIANRLESSREIPEQVWRWFEEQTNS